MGEFEQRRRIEKERQIRPFNEPAVPRLGWRLPGVDLTVEQIG